MRSLKVGSLAALFIVLMSLTCKGTEPENGYSGFIVRQDGKTLQAIGDTKTRHAPFSTFKIVLALMGFNEGILQSKDLPKWSFHPEYEKQFQGWYTHEKGLEYHWCQDHTPATFMKNSVVWFSHQITQRLGKEKFSTYVMQLDYGNCDVSGTPGQDDGLINSWLGTSLKISVEEQITFLERLCAKTLPVSKKAQEKTMQTMDRDEEWDGWKLFGKTGGGRGDNGWFVGWIEKDAKRIIFAQYLNRKDPKVDLTGVDSVKSVATTAKSLIKKRVLELLKQ